MICLQYASVCIRMHPYASIRLIYAPERQCSTHAFAEKVKKSKNSRNLLFYNVFRSAKSIQIQPINPILINVRKIEKNTDWFELGNYIALAIVPSWVEQHCRLVEVPMRTSM